jgi:hypothetical protein
MKALIQPLVLAALVLTPAACATEVAGEDEYDEEMDAEEDGEYEVQASCSPTATTGASAPRPMIAAKWFEGPAADTMWLSFGRWQGPTSSAYVEYNSDPNGPSPASERGTYTFWPSPCNRQYLVMSPSTGGSFRWRLTYLPNGDGPADDKLKLYFNNTDPVPDYTVFLRRCLYARCPG